MIQMIYFNNFITIISFFVNVIFVYTLIRKLCIYFTEKRYIKKVLGFTKDTVQITHGIFHLTTDIGIKNNFITYASLDSINNIIKLLNKVGQHFELTEQNGYIKNEVNIGGFMVNKKVNAYFSKHFLGFRYITDIEYKDKYEEYPIDTSFIEYSNKNFGFWIKDKKFLEVEYGFKDYAFLIKMVEADFKNENNKTVHILFGASDKATYIASQYFLTHCKKIFEKFKEKHYFIAVEVNLVDDSINSSRGIIDLTEEMFELEQVF